MAGRSAEGPEPSSRKPGRRIKTPNGAQGELPALLGTAWHALRGQGDLARARDLFDRAARLAEAQGDAQALGEAALGADGFWLHEQRSPVAQALVGGWRRAALAEVDPSSRLAVRLRVRDAAERDYESGGTKAVLAALPEARRCGDRAALAEALHLAQHCLLGPKFTKLRSTLGEELLAVAAAADDPFEACRGLMWRATNLLLTGHPHADRALTLLRAALAEHRHLAMSYVVSAVDVMLAIRAGALERAEQLAEESASLGRQAGDLDVLGWYGAHLVTIRFFQGKGEELLPMLQELVASPELSEPNDAFLGALATAASMTGDSWTATSALRRLRRPNLAALRHNSLWLVTVFGAVLAARLLEDKDVAAEAYELLLPFAELPVTASFAITCMGSAQYPLAVAAATLERWDVAVNHFRQAMAANEALGHRPAHVLSEAGLGEALAVTGEAAESARCIARAQAAATALGMDAWCARWRQSAAPAQPDAKAQCVRHGAMWHADRGRAPRDHRRLTRRSLSGDAAEQPRRGDQRARARPAAAAGPDRGGPGRAGTARCGCQAGVPPAHHRAAAADRRGRVRLRSDPRGSGTFRTGLATGRARTRDRARRALPRLPHLRRTCALLGPESDPACPGSHRDSRP